MHCRTDELWAVVTANALMEDSETGKAASKLSRPKSVAHYIFEDVVLPGYSQPLEKEFELGHMIAERATPKQGKIEQEAFDAGHPVGLQVEGDIIREAFPQAHNRNEGRMGEFLSHLPAKPRTDKEGSYGYFFDYGSVGFITTNAKQLTRILAGQAEYDTNPNNVTGARQVQAGQSMNAIVETR